MNIQDLYLECRMCADNFKGEEFEERFFDKAEELGASDQMLEDLNTMLYQRHFNCV